MELAEKWAADLRGVLRGSSPLIQDVRVGVFYTAVRLSSGHVGLAFTPRNLAETVCCPRTAASAPPAGRMKGQSAWQLATQASSRNPLCRAVGVATLNALSALGMERHGTPGGELHVGMDALDAAEVGPVDRVAMVGAIIPFIKALKGHVASLEIIDKHPQSLKPDEQRFYDPPERASHSLERATVVILSGSALVEGGLDDLLRAASTARQVVLAGPTASPWPPTFFERGVSILGGIRSQDSERLLSLVSEGGSGYQFAQVAEKISIVRTQAGTATAFGT